MPFSFRKKKDDSVAIDNLAKDGYGQVTMPNPGELPADWQERDTPLASLGSGVPATGNRAGGGSFMDNGAKVGYLRNLEFSAGGRSALVRTGTTGTAVPHVSPTTGQVQVSSALDTASAGTLDTEQPAQPGLAKTGGDQIDSADGSVGPERRRDTKLD